MHFRGGGHSGVALGRYRGGERRTSGGGGEYQGMRHNRGRGHQQGGGYHERGGKGDRCVDRFHAKHDDHCINEHVNKLLHLAVGCSPRLRAHETTSRTTVAGASSSLSPPSFPVSCA